MDDGGLTLFRASGGGRPLYFSTAVEGAVFVGSELEPLARMTGARAHPTSLARHFAEWPERGSVAICPLDRVSCLSVNEKVRVGGGSCVRALAGERRVEARAGSSAGALADELWLQIRAAVRRSIGGSERVAVLVSGGLDSSGLVAALLEEGREVLPITLDFACTGDDRPHVRALEQAFGLEVVRLEPTQARGLCREVFVADAAPILHGSAPFELLFSRTAEALGADVLLTGVGGDDVLAGDFRAFAGEFRGRPLATLARLLTLQLPWPMGARQRLQHYLFEPLLGGTPLVAPIRRRRALRYKANFPFAGPELREVLEEAGEGSVHRQKEPASPTERFHAIADAAWTGDIATRRAQIEALSKIPRRDPFMDPDLLAFAAALPVSVLQRGGWHRGLYRAALAGRVPESIRMRRDKGRFEPALAALFSAEGGLDAFPELLRMEAMGALGLVEPEAFRRWTDALRPLGALDSDQVWTLFRALSLEAFARRFS